MNFLVDIAPLTYGSIIFLLIVYGVGFTLGSFGGLFSECSGIINIALDGAMLIGAFSGISFCRGIAGAMNENPLISNYWFANLIYILGLIVCILVSLAFSFLLSFVSIKFKADQTIVGTALNSVVTAIVLIANTIILNKDKPEVDVSMFMSATNIKSGNEFIDGCFSNMNLTLVIGIIMIVILVLTMNKTKFGLRLRACGENPQAADSVGINVNRMRYIGTAIGTTAAGAGGYIIFSCLKLGEWSLNSGVFGYGFLVLAIEILGNWKAINVTISAWIFAAFFAFANFMTVAFSSGNAFYNSKAFYMLLPYLLTLLSLIIFSKKSHAPKSEGIPYDKSSR